MNSLQTWESRKQLLGKQRVGISRRRSFSCRRCLLGGEEPAELTSDIHILLLDFHPTVEPKVGQR